MIYLTELFVMHSNNWNYSNLVTYVYKSYIRGAYDKFPDFFVWAFKMVLDS